MSVVRSQDAGERQGISEAHGYERHMSCNEKLKLGSFCHIDSFCPALNGDTGGRRGDRNQSDDLFAVTHA